MHRIVGLDISSDRLSLVALESGFRGFAVKEARTAVLPEGGTQPERVRAALDELGLVPPLGPDDTIAVALPGAVVASHLVTLPFVDARRIEQVLPAEVEGAIPFDLEEVIWDHAVLSQAAGKTEVLVGIVRKTVLKEYLEALAAVGVDPRVVTFGPLALAALGEKQQLLGDDGKAQVEGEPGPTVALLDAGPDRCDLTLLSLGTPVLARALGTSSAAAWEAATRDETARARLIGVIARDLKITLRSRRVALTRILLTGPITAVPGAAERLGLELQLPTATIALAACTPETALAFGLALRAQHPRGHINFRKGEQAFTKDLSQVRGQMGRLSIAAAVLLVLALVLGIAHVNSLHRQAADYDEALCTATKRILGACMTDYRQALAAISGGKSKAAGIPRVSGADVLSELIAHMPDDALPTLEDLEVTTTSIRVKGVAESFGKVDEIIASLKKDKCFGEIKQPRVEKQREGTKITFSLDFGYTCSGEQGGA